MLGTFSGKKMLVVLNRKKHWRCSIQKSGKFFGKTVPIIEHDNVLLSSLANQASSSA